MGVHCSSSEFSANSVRSRGRRRAAAALAAPPPPPPRTPRTRRRLCPPRPCPRREGAAPDRHETGWR
eukprot:scaffold23170_cov67-Phaeocystis_antarctica.AAC.5